MNETMPNECVITGSMSNKNENVLSIDITPESEVWKPVRGFEGLYDVSSLGRIKRAAGSTWGQYKLKSDRLLNVHPTKKGYFTVSLYDYDNKKKTFMIHQIVARTFLGDNACCSSCGNTFEINHKDRNKKNNRLDNLEYVTHIENMKHYHDDRLSPNFMTIRINSL